MADSQDTTAQENSIALDDCNDLISIPIDLINKSNEQQQDLVTTTTNQSNNQTQMIRGVPQRRTFDSGYGEGQSCISSPIAEPKKNCNSNGNGNYHQQHESTSSNADHQMIGGNRQQQQCYRHIISIDSLVINKELGIGEFGVVQQGNVISNVFSFDFLTNFFIFHHRRCLDQ